jgi:CrcB protein
MRRLMIVFAGGGVGSCLRALVLAWLAPWAATLPVPVLLANLVGAFVLSVVVVLADEAGLLRPETRLFLAVGVLGGFTTFSTFGWGADLLIAHQASGAALIYVGASLVGGVVAVGAGLVVGRELVVALERAAVALLERLEERGLRRIGVARVHMATIEAEDRAEFTPRGDERAETAGARAADAHGRR